MGRLLKVVFVVWCLLALWTTLHHEAWWDEAEVWLAARDGGLSNILGNTWQRGAPALWYLAVWPFAAAGAPYVAQQLLNLAFAAAAVWLVLARAPLPPLVRALFPFSYFPMFEFTAVARPYALLMFLVLTVAALWNGRDEKPLPLAVAIALLANVSAHGLIISSVAGALLAAEWVSKAAWRRGRTLTAIGVMVAAGLASFVQILPRSDTVTERYRPDVADTVSYTVASAFFPDYRVTSYFLPGLLVLLLVTVAVSRRPVAPLFLWVSTTLLLLVFVFVWMGGIRHAGIVLILAVAALWIADSYGPFRLERQAMAALALSLAMSIVPAAKSVVLETEAPFSGSRDLAAYLRRTGLDKAELVGEERWIAVLNYLPGKQFWSASRGVYLSYRPLDGAAFEPGPEIVYRRAMARFPGKRWLFVTGSSLTEPSASRFRLLYESAPVWSLHGERYRVYEPVGPARRTGLAPS